MFFSRLVFALTARKLYNWGWMLWLCSTGTSRLVIQKDWGVAFSWMKCLFHLFLTCAEVLLLPFQLLVFTSQSWCSCFCLSLRFQKTFSLTLTLSKWKQCCDHMCRVQRSPHWPDLPYSLSPIPHRMSSLSLRSVYFSPIGRFIFIFFTEWLENGS